MPNRFWLAPKPTSKEAMEFLTKFFIKMKSLVEMLPEPSIRKITSAPIDLHPMKNSKHGYHEAGRKNERVEKGSYRQVDWTVLGHAINISIYDAWVFYIKSDIA